MSLLNNPPFWTLSLTPSVCPSLFVKKSCFLFFRLTKNCNVKVQSTGVYDPKVPRLSLTVAHLTSRSSQSVNGGGSRPQGRLLEDGDDGSKLRGQKSLSFCYLMTDDFFRVSSKKAVKIERRLITRDITSFVFL